MKHTKAQRALAYISAIGGLTKAEADGLLAEVGYAPVTQGSWEMLVSSYAPLFRADPQLMGRCIERPMSIADLSSAVKGSQTDVPLLFEDDSES